MKNCSEHDFELFRISRGEWAPLVLSRLHLLACPSCRARVSELRTVSATLEGEFGPVRDPKAFRRLSTPLVAAIILGGLIAFASLATEAGFVPIGQNSPAPAALDTAHAASCGNETPTPIHTQTKGIEIRHSLPKPLPCKGKPVLQTADVPSKPR